MNEKKRTPKRDLQLADDWQWVSGTAQGRRIIADLMVWGNVYSQIDTDDPIAMAKAVGENNFAKRVAYLLGVKPEIFPAQSWEHTDILDRMLQSQPMRN